MFIALPQLKMAARFIGGVVVGVLGSGTFAGWLFTVFEWLGVQMDSSKGSLGLVGWGATLATWAAAEFVGQTVAAAIARSVSVIWFVAAAHAGLLLGVYYFAPHPALLVGAPLGFLIAYRIKDSDFVTMVARVPANP